MIPNWLDLADAYPLAAWLLVSCAAFCCGYLLDAVLRSCRAPAIKKDPEWLAVLHDLCSDLVMFCEEEAESRQGAGEEYEAEAARALVTARVLASWVRDQCAEQGAPVYGLDRAGVDRG